MLIEIFLGLIFFSMFATVIMTFVGTFWIDRLYRSSAELTFPEKISDRSRFRRPILFCSFAVLNGIIFLSTNMPEKFFLPAAIFFLVLMTVTDFEQYMIFDAMTLPFAILGAAYVWQMNLDIFDHATAAVIGGGFFLLLAIFTKGAIGGGDVKLVAALGLWLGSENLLNVVIFATLIGGLAATFMILAKQKDCNSYFAYGPYFALTAIYFLVAPQPL